jgi:hypothetical protein
MKTGIRGLDHPNQGTAEAAPMYLLCTVRRCRHSLHPDRKMAPPYVAHGMYDCEKLKLFFHLLPPLKARVPPCYFENTTEVVFPRGTLYVNTEEL